MPISRAKWNGCSRSLPVQQQRTGASTSTATTIGPISRLPGPIASTLVFTVLTVCMPKRVQLPQSPYASHLQPTSGYSSPQVDRKFNTQSNKPNNSTLSWLTSGRIIAKPTSNLPLETYRQTLARIPLAVRPYSRTPSTAGNATVDRDRMLYKVTFQDLDCRCEPPGMPAFSHLEVPVIERLPVRISPLDRFHHRDVLTCPPLATSQAGLTIPRHSEIAQPIKEGQNSGRARPFDAGRTMRFVELCTLGDSD